MRNFHNAINDLADEYPENRKILQEAFPDAFKRGLFLIHESRGTDIADRLYFYTNPTERDLQRYIVNLNGSFSCDTEEIYPSASTPAFTGVIKIENGKIIEALET